MIKKTIPFQVEDLGNEMYSWATDLFPINRSITGPGVRETLSYVKGLLPELEIHEVKSGTKAFDWTVPDEWTIREAYIEDEKGSRIVDFKNNNLHIVGYSVPINDWFTLAELEDHLYSLPDMPDAIPYVTTYYEKNWGFCLTHNQRMNLIPKKYHVVIDSEIKPGVLNYGELLIQGNNTKEVLFSTYICHPSLANNELSGPVVSMALAKWLTSQKDLEFSYRFVLLPETIGSIVYISKNMDYLKKNTIAAFNITCVGDEKCYSFLPSRNGNTLSDKVLMHALKHTDQSYKKYTWLQRGSDERQYCAPGVDLPMATFSRSKSAEYTEYHTSLDDLSFITPYGLQGSFALLSKVISILENNVYPKINVLCEPQLGKRNLYPNISTSTSWIQVQTMMDLISFADGKLSLLEIAEKIDKPFWALETIYENLCFHGLMEAQETPSDWISPESDQL